MRAIGSIPATTVTEATQRRRSSTREYAYRIPEAFDDVQASPLLCAGIIGYRSLKRSQLPPGGRLAMYGFGSSAHIVLQIVLARGSEVYVVTRGESHRRLAREMGATCVGADVREMPRKTQSGIMFAPAGELVPGCAGPVGEGGNAGDGRNL